MMSRIVLPDSVGVQSSRAPGREGRRLKAKPWAHGHAFTEHFINQPYHQNWRISLMPISYPAIAYKCMQNQFS